MLNKVILQSGQIYKISEVFAQKTPVLYQLLDIANDKVPGYFYKEELTKSEPLDFKKNYFMVEKILKTKYVKGVKYSLVKYLFYPNKVEDNKKARAQASYAPGSRSRPDRAL